MEKIEYVLLFADVNVLTFVVVAVLTSLHSIVCVLTSIPRGWVPDWDVVNADSKSALSEDVTGDSSRIVAPPPLLLKKLTVTVADSPTEILSTVITG